MQDHPKSDATSARRGRHVVVLNDTSGRSHFGCSRVMQQLISGLERQGLQITARSPARHDWQQDADMLAAIKAADLVVINGEGTLHHGRPAGLALLQVVEHATCPVALINALYQDNPDDWNGPLSKCALLAARDSKSAAEMQATGTKAPVRTVPDLSLSGGARHSDLSRVLLVFGDSVRMNIRRALAKASRRMGADVFLPIKTLHHAVLYWTPTRWIARKFLYGAYNGTLPLGSPALEFANSEAQYLDMISRANLHVTGRFHSVCLSLVTGTPFLAVGSNSWKIQTLLTDAGLGAERVISLDDLEKLSAGDGPGPFTEIEQDKIAAFLEHSQEQAEELFRDLAELAASGAVKT